MAAEGRDRDAPPRAKESRTKDLDLAAPNAADLDAAQEALERAASRDLGDHIRFQLTGARETGLGQNQPGVDNRRLVFTAQDAGTGRKLSTSRPTSS